MVDKNDKLATNFWDESNSDLPVIAFALHGGHVIGELVASELVLKRNDRRREEDPYTGLLSTIAPTWLNAGYSRFEVDLNRQRKEAVYPPEVWGLRVWSEEPSQELVASSLQKYDAFYDRARILLDDMAKRHPKFLVLDLHSYNHRRQGPYSPADPPELNPEINIGTGNVDRSRWGQVIDQFMGSLSEFNYHGRKLDVRENVRQRMRPPRQSGTSPRPVQVDLPGRHASTPPEYLPARSWLLLWARAGICHGFQRRHTHPGTIFEKMVRNGRGPRHVVTPAGKERVVGVVNLVQTA